MRNLVAMPRQRVAPPPDDVGGSSESPLHSSRSPALASVVPGPGICKHLADRERVATRRGCSLLADALHRSRKACEACDGSTSGSPRRTIESGSEIELCAAPRAAINVVLVGGAHARRRAAGGSSRPARDESALPAKLVRGPVSPAIDTPDLARGGQRVSPFRTWLIGRRATRLSGGSAATARRSASDDLSTGTSSCMRDHPDPDPDG
jgi:hypothetical protein